VEGYCTCGAKLAADSLFCHRCGRALRDYLPVDEAPEPEPEPAPAPVIVETAPEPGPLAGFQSGAAVRCGVIAAALTFLLMFPAVMLGGNTLQLVVTFLGGFYAVFLYRRRTGGEVTVLSGARVGWITGIFLFTLFTVLTTLGMAMLATSSEVMQAYEAQVKSMGASGEAARQMIEVMRNPGGFAMFLGGLLLYLFMISTLLCSLGGALGARFQTHSRQ
jgi:hypothetical protein